MDKLLSEQARFMREYVIARASAHIGGLDGAIAAKEALKAWNELLRIVAESEGRRYG